MSFLKLALTVLILMFGESYCDKATYKPLLSKARSSYEELVNLKISKIGPLLEHEQNIVNKTFESLSLCEEEEEDSSGDDGFLNICLCNLEDCFELYCSINNYLDLDECTEATNSTIENINFKILYTYDNLKKYEDGLTVGLQSLNSLDDSYSDNSDILILRESQDTGYEIQRLNMKCFRKIFENRKSRSSRWLDNTTVSYVINLISFFSLIIIILLFTMVKELGVPISGKCWIQYSITSLCNYVHIIFLSLYLFNEKKEVNPLYFYISVSAVVLLILCCRIKKQGFGKNWFIFSISFVFLHLTIFLLDIMIDTNFEILHYISWMFHAISYFATEFSIYFWLNIICFDTFYSTKALRLPNANSDSKRFFVYCLVCCFIPFTISLGLLLSILLHGIPVTDLVLPAALQRLSPFSTFMSFMTNYLKIVGSTEIIIKFVTVSFFLAYAFAIWKHKRDLSRIDLTVHTQRPTKIESTIFKVRMGILTFMILGSLLCNIVIYVSNVFGRQYLLCNWKLKFLEELNPIFELLKRLNGLYVLIYIFTGREYWRAMGRKMKILKENMTELTTYNR